MFDPEIGEFVNPFDFDQAKKQIKEGIEILSQVSPSNQSVRNYNSLIPNYFAQPEILRLLLHLLIEYEDNSPASKITITFISTYLKKQNQHGVNVVRHNKKMIYKNMREIFFCDSVSSSNKLLLQSCFTRFIGHLSPEFISIRTELTQSIVSYFNQELSPSNLKNCFYLIRSILNGPLETQSLRYLQQSLLINFITLSNQLIKAIKNDLEGEIGNGKIAQMIQWAYSVQQITQLLYEKTTMDKLQVLKQQAFTSTQFVTLCHNTLTLQFNNIPSFIIPFTQQQNANSLITQLNQLKVSVLNMIQNTFQILLKNRKHLVGPKYLSTMTIADLFLDSILPKLAEEIAQYPNITLPNENILVKFILILSKIIRIPHLQGKNMKLRDLIFFRLVYPCLLTSPKDLELNSEDFCRMKNNIITEEDEKVNFTVHEAAGKLCESLADELDGVVTFAFRTIINLIDFQLTADPKYYQNLPESLVESYYYQNSNYFQQIEAGLTVLSIISYYGDNRMDLCQEFEQLIVRRQQFFSRIDVSCDMLVCFIQASTFYLSNFCQLIIQGKANAQFHQALVNHMMELMSASYCVQKKDFFEDERGKVGYQARDYIENLVSQKLFFGALFPDHDPLSLEKLKKFFANICQYLTSNFAPKILEDIIIQFLKRQISVTYQENYRQMSANLKGQLSIFITETIFGHYQQQMPNQTICKVKIFETLKMMIVFTTDPHRLMEIAFSQIENVLQKEFAYLDDVVEVLQVFMKRVYKQSLALSKQLGQIIEKSVDQAIRVSDNEVFQNPVFDLLMHCNLLGLYSNTIVLALLDLFKDNRVQKQVDQEAQVIMEKCLYLILQICYSHFNSVNGNTWLLVIDQMIDYLRVNYVRQDTLTVGKSVAICLCCYTQDLEGFEEYLGKRMDGIWDCIIEDELKYSTKTEKKIVAYKLLQLLSSPNIRPSIVDRTMSILKCATILIYYNYQKQEISWHEDQDDSESMESLSKDDEKKHEPWIEPYTKMKDNPFLLGLPDQILLMRDICHSINERDSAGFRKFIQNQPIGLQNLLRNKIYNYKEGYKPQSNKKLRTIVKVRRPQNLESQR